MSEAYSATVLDHFKHPRNAGVLEHPDGFSSVSNPASGATLNLYMQVVDDRVSRVVFQAEGCTATLAAASILTELVQGKTLETAGAISRMQIEEALGGLPPTRKHAAALAEDAVRAVLKDYRARVRA